MLVRSLATDWRKSSVVAIDAGVLMSAIERILSRDLKIVRDEESNTDRSTITEGPFAGLVLPSLTSRANAAYIFREIISSVLITHPHLDHVSGLAMNTPAVEFQSGPKTVTALPSAIAALKNHVFNDITWPNLSDEDGGAGLITYQRLVDGGNMRLGRGEGKGYIKICEGLATKCIAVSHGTSKLRYNPETGKHHRAESTVFAADSLLLPSRRVSVDVSDIRSVFGPHLRAHGSLSVPRTFSPARNSIGAAKDPVVAAVESSAFFIRDETTGGEIIVFGDVEPDSISLEPRNTVVWDAAAPKIASGVLRAIFIECSYSDSVEDATLYGHLCPRHLIDELSALAAKVTNVRNPQKKVSDSRKRKRRASDPSSRTSQTDAPLSPKSLRPKDMFASESNSRLATPKSTRGISGSGVTCDASPGTKLSEFSKLDAEQMDIEKADPPKQQSLPLEGLSVFIIHVKESLMDGVDPRKQILEELREGAKEARLGCEFYAPLSGETAFV